jgi:hypothetical protein
MKLTVQQIMDLKRDVDHLESILDLAAFAKEYDAADAQRIVKRMREIVDGLLEIEVQA